MASEPISDSTLAADAPVRAARRPLAPAAETLSPSDKLWLFWENNRTAILGALGLLVALALVAGGLTMWRAGQNDKASERLAATLPLFEQGKYAAALRDSTGRTGLTSIADEFGGTKAGNLAKFYAAQALFETKRYDDALRYFDSFDGEDTFLDANALAAQAAILENKGQAADAAAKYADAADASESPLFAPGYLLAAARAYLAAGNADQAKAALDKLKEDYADTPEAQETDFLYGQIDGKSTAQ